MPSDGPVIIGPIEVEPQKAACPSCGHRRHTGAEWAGICIGCPCPLVYEDGVWWEPAGSDWRPFVKP